jgi:hypothetical protein
MLRTSSNMSELLKYFKSVGSSDNHLTATRALVFEI